MKKLSLILALLVTGFSSMAQIPNGDFETLNSDGTLRNWGNVYIWMITIDSLGNSTVDSMAWDSEYYYEPTTDAHSGNYAMMLSNAWDYTANVGFSGSASVDTDTMYMAWGSLEFVPFNQSPTSIDFYYKYTSVNGDSGAMNLALYDTMGNVVGTAQFIFPATVSNYTYVSVPVNYIASDPVVYYSLNYTTKFSTADYPNDPSLGSRLYIDDVSFGGLSGINHVAEKAPIELAPNPTSGMVMLNSNYTYQSTLQVLSPVGQLVYSTTVFPGKNHIDLSDLPKGVYVLRVGNSTSQLVLCK